MRKLKYHEKKLLKKVNFFEWKRYRNVQENKIIRKYRIQDREDYTKYNKLSGYITKLVSLLRKLKEDDKERIQITNILLNKLYDIGIIDEKSSLSVCNELSASAFCRRRLAVILVKNKYCKNLEQACTYIEQGHIRVDKDLITSAAYHVTRDLEDKINWSENSTINHHINAFNGTIDDFAITGCM